MKCGLIAVALAALVCTSQAGADYLRVKVDVKNATPYPAAANVQTPEGGLGTVGGTRPPGFGKGGGVQAPIGGQPANPAAGKENEGERQWVTAYLEIKG